MTITDETKDEVERLLVAPIQIGTTWVSRTLAPYAVIVQGFTSEGGKVRVSKISPHGTMACPEFNIVDFHVAFKLLPFQ